MALPLLSRINTSWLVATDPLTPAMKMHASPKLLAGCLGISDEPEVGLETLLSQAQGEPLNSACEPTCARIGIGSSNDRM